MTPSLPTAAVETWSVRTRAVPLFLALLAVTAGFPSSPAVAAGNPTSRIALTVRIDVGDGAVSQYSLRCSPTSGNHPNRWAACRALLAGGAKLLSPVPADAMCTQIYGGPQRANVSGTWNGKRVAAEFTRSDGCHIAKWEAIRALFKVPGMTYTL